MYNLSNIVLVIVLLSFNVLGFDINNYIASKNIVRKTVRIQWDSVYKLVSSKQERNMAPHLIKPAEYFSSFYLPSSRMNEIETLCKENSMTIDQALSLRKQLMVNKIINSTSKLRKLEKEIEQSYNKGISITKLMNKYDLPPVAILRVIFTNRVRKANPDMFDRDIRDIVKDILSDGQYQDVYLSLSDKEQLAIAKSLDQNSYSNDPNERLQSENWEDILYQYLDKNNINYITENILKELKHPLTPDVLMIDEVYINNKVVNWFDSKNYYGSTSFSFLNKLEKQIDRYNNAFGFGSVIFRLGMNRKLVDTFPNTLFVDSGPLPTVSMTGTRVE